MRLKIVLIGLYALLVGSAEATQQAIVQAYLSVYTRTVYLPDEKKRECAELLRSELARVADALTVDTLRPIEALMHEKLCLDKYSWLHPAFARRGDVQEGVEMRVVGETLYVRIRSFQQGAAKRFDRAYESLPNFQRRRVMSIALDVRGNGGGLVWELKTILDVYFSPRPGVRFLVSESTAESDREHTTSKEGVWSNLPTLIIVDRNTASAAEWIASSIRHELNPYRSTIVGERTFGKAVVQCTSDMEVGEKVARILATCGEWKAAGAKVQGVGLEPDLTIDVPCKNEDSCIMSLVAKLVR